MRRCFFTLFAIALTACGGTDTSAPQPASTSVEAIAEAPSENPGSNEVALCLPLVHGCGCAYQCASSVEALEGDRHRVVHDGQDSRLDQVHRERWCFTPAGSGSPAGAAPVDATDCMDVFYDLSPCGGECIPSTEFLRCHREGDRCAPDRR